MQKFVASQTMKPSPNKPISCKSLLTWKWAVYDSFIIGTLIIGILAQIH